MLSQQVISFQNRTFANTDKQDCPNKSPDHDHGKSPKTIQEEEKLEEKQIQVKKQDSNKVKVANKIQKSKNISMLLPMECQNLIKFFSKKSWSFLLKLSQQKSEIIQKIIFHDLQMPVNYNPTFKEQNQHRMKLTNINSQPYLLTMGAKRNECYVIELFHQGRAEIIQKIRTRKPIIDIGVYHNNDLNGLLDNLVVLQTAESIYLYSSIKNQKNIYEKINTKSKKRKVLEKFRQFKNQVSDNLTHCAITRNNQIIGLGIIQFGTNSFSPISIAADHGNKNEVQAKRKRENLIFKKLNLKKVSLISVLKSEGIPDSIKLGDIEILISIEQTNELGKFSSVFHLCSLSSGIIVLFQFDKSLQYKWVHPFFHDEEERKMLTDKDKLFMSTQLNISASFLKIANVQINKNGSKFIKPLIIVGSKRSSSVYILNQLTLEIIYRYQITGFKGGFTHAEVFGEIQYNRGINKGEYIALARTDNVISIISLNKLTKYKKPNTCKKQIHECEQITVGTTDTIKIPEEERIMSMSAGGVLGNSKKFILCVMSLKTKEYADENPANGQIKTDSTSEVQQTYFQKIRRFEIQI